MSSFDGSEGVNADICQSAGGQPGRGIDSLLLETLIYALIEKGVMTKNDGLSIVQTVAEITLGSVEGDTPGSQTAGDLKLLQRMFASFQAIDDRPGTVDLNGGNVHQLRPPVHGDGPQFPEVD